MRVNASCGLGLATTLFLIGCGERPQPTSKRTRENHIATSPSDSGRNLRAILDSGELRVLTTQPDTLRLPRRVSPSDYDLALLNGLAERLNVDLKIINVEEFENLIPALLTGEGDVAAANLAITTDRRREIAFSVPVASTREEIVVRSDADARTVKDLAGETIWIERGSCYGENAAKLKKRFPAINVRLAEADVDTEELLHKVAIGEIDATIADDNYVEAFQTYCPDVKVVHVFPGKRFISWGVRPTAVDLLEKINTFLLEALPKYAGDAFTGDLPAISDRKILRVLTRNNPSCYFIHRGELMGFEFELIRDFAKRHGLRAVAVTPPKWNDLIPWLVAGKGDVVAAAVTITDQREKNPSTAFCHPYGDISEKVVARAEDDSIKTIADLNGRTFAVRKNSSYWETLTKLRESGVKLKLRAIPQNVETFQIINGVAEGTYDLTLADDLIVDAESTRRLAVKSPLTLPAKRHYGWMVRSGNVKLKRAINDFFKTMIGTKHYNVLVAKYFKSPKLIDAHAAARGKRNLSPYDALFKRVAAKYGFPWSLIAAQAYQESRFNPRASDQLGAKGLMQIMPTTARELKVKGSLFNPEINVDAGARYMRAMRNRFTRKNIDSPDDFCFSLASYNGGYGHVLDARRLAQRLRLDDDRWFDNVEKAMEKLKEPRHYERARYGFCHGDMINDYVRDIMTRHDAYQKWNESLNRGCPFQNGD